MPDIPKLDRLPYLGIQSPEREGSSLSTLARSSDLNLQTIMESVARNPQDRYFKDQRVYLDGYVFTNCCFNHCELHSETGIFVLKSCMIMQNCVPFFGASALRVIKMLNLFFPNQLLSHPVYNVVNEAHGTITLE